MLGFEQKNPDGHNDSNVEPDGQCEPDEQFRREV
jgi:hypothetical protein